jgi:hypothetical protein
MSHPQQLEFFRVVRAHLPGLFERTAVLEIGSFDVNGSIRQHFQGCDYWGVDLMAGPGVDEVVASGHEFQPRLRASYDVTVSTECFEHNPFYFETFVNMIRLTRKGGAVLFTCASKGRAEHGTARTSPDSSPGTQASGWDYYRNLCERDFTSKIDLRAHFVSHRFFFHPVPCDLYFVGVKHPASGELPVDLAALERAHAAIIASIEVGSRNPVGRKLRTLDRFMASLLIKDSVYQDLWTVRARPHVLQAWRALSGIS